MNTHLLNPGPALGYVGAAGAAREVALVAGGAAMGSGGASIVAACAARKVAGEAGGAASVALHVVREPAKLGPEGSASAAGLRRGRGGAPRGGAVGGVLGDRLLRRGLKG